MTNRNKVPSDKRASMMTPLKTWKPCLADIYKGVAFFDGITIESDRITDPRWDRVLPVMEEEQVFMCRMMAPLLKSARGSSVLDIGTGSGVFAIVAAKLDCAVVGIDICPRAIRFSRHNAKQNKVSVAESAPKRGQIQFLVHDFMDYKSDQFDLILINPPFNPTCDGFNPAIHAKAGLLGQDCFEEWLPRVAPILKPGGRCIGIHMMLVEEDGSLNMRRLLEKHFPGASCEYKFVLDPFPVKDLLEAEYESVRDCENVHRYLEQYVPPYNKRFGLVYFEIHTASDPTRRSEVPMTAVNEGSKPTRTWVTDRLPLHRNIIEHTSLEHSFPAPALFLNDYPVPHVPSLRLREPRLEPPLPIVDKWVRQQSAIRTNARDNQFSWILVEVAPWYPTPAGRKALFSCCVLWGSPEGIGLYGEKLLRCYAKNTRSVQRTFLAPFLHPHFTGERDPTAWRGIHLSINKAAAASSIGESSISPFSGIVGLMVERICREFTRLSDEFEQFDDQFTYSDPDSRSPEEPDFVAFRSSLEALEVGLLADHHPKPEKWIQRIKNAAAGAQLSAIKPEEIELELRHQADHRRLDQIIRDLGFDGDYTTYFAGLPVSLRSPRENVARHEELPASFRGGIWIYAVGHAQWEPRAERFVLDLARLLGMLYEAQYSEQAGEELRRMGRYEARAAMFHHIPKDFGTLVEQLTKVSEYSKKPNAKVSRIRHLIPDTDATAFMIMELDAGSGDASSSYTRLPEDIVGKLDRGCSFELVQNIYRRLVVPYVHARIGRNATSYTAAFERDREDLTPTDLRRKYPLPRIERFDRFCLPKGREAYVWLLLALRSAAYHAFLDMIAKKRVEPGRIGIIACPEPREIVVSNTGLPPKDARTDNQNGWRRDISVFTRDHESWRVFKKDPDQYSVWEPNQCRWLTRIIYERG
jgi:SAM-dependent methyltransferase